jgi:ABC-2 type transport system ATP-binding protein
MAVKLESRALTKRFGNITAVDGLSFTIEGGEVFALLGPNGAGKTTAISIICGLLAPDSGAVLFDGEDSRTGRSGIKKRVGLCPQNIVVWDRLTCFEQLVFMAELYGCGRAEARENASRLLDDLDLAPKRNRLAKTLSGGMKRRLNIALALVHDPDIIVLDESEAGLDPQSRVLVREYVRSLAKRKTVLLTTHDMDEAERISDRVAIMDSGKLLVVDTPKALLERFGEGGRPAVDLEAVFIKLTGKRLRE